MTPARRPSPRPAGTQVLAALCGGAVLGAVVAALLHAAIQRTATPLSPERAFWQFLLLAFGGALAGFALSSVSALQASNPDPEYHRPRQPQRPSSQRRPPGPG